ncbi:MAG: carbohydrate-binding family 9-like protein [Abditibacteriota bacterium]|nr:carbohydrate-binding family 9-like protein [Abditibacteriota bacterium]MBP5093944.1 carbohydrate-binding family 9-like protein [Abditibacteriota bacterium]MBP5739140.1 carbohydrate-binding family 9-like protein [Abditibacteriota bacterium]
MKTYTKVAAAAFGVFAAVCAAAYGGTPTYKAVRIGDTHVVNGDYRDKAWMNAPEITMRLATTGKKAVKTTRAKIGYDDKYLYFVFYCEDEEIYANMTERDDHIFEEDVVEMFIAPHGLKDYFEINVSPINVIFDSHIFYGKDAVEKGDVSWDCAGIKTAVKVEGKVNDPSVKDEYWSAEVAVPFESIGMETPAKGSSIRGNVYRIDRRPQPKEFQAWSPTMRDPAAFHVPKKFGKIIFD